jgi:superfamily II RNA helicase
VQELDKLLRRGIAYHHAGMLPILREYVELLFQVRG